MIALNSSAQDCNPRIEPFNEQQTKILLEGLYDRYLSKKSLVHFCLMEALRNELFEMEDGGYTKFRLSDMEFDFLVKAGAFPVFKEMEYRACGSEDEKLKLMNESYRKGDYFELRFAGLSSDVDRVIVLDMKNGQQALMLMKKLCNLEVRKKIGYVRIYERVPEMNSLPLPCERMAIGMNHNLIEEVCKVVGEYSFDYGDVLPPFCDRKDWMNLTVGERKAKSYACFADEVTLDLVYFMTRTRFLKVEAHRSILLDLLKKQYATETGGKDKFVNDCFASVTLHLKN